MGKFEVEIYDKELLSWLNSVKSSIVDVFDAIRKLCGGKKYEDVKDIFDILSNSLNSTHKEQLDQKDEKIAELRENINFEAEKVASQKTVHLRNKIDVLQNELENSKNVTSDYKRQLQEKNITLSETYDKEVRTLQAQLNDVILQLKSEKENKSTEIAKAEINKAREVEKELNIQIVHLQGELSKERSSKDNEIIQAERIGEQRGDEKHKIIISKLEAEILDIKNGRLVPAIKGKEGEDIYYRIFRELYVGWDIKYTAKTGGGHQGDIWLTRPSTRERKSLTILVDIKWYGSKVEQSQINQLKHDMISHNRHGILISHETLIIGRSQWLDWEFVENGLVILYLSNINADKHLIETAISLLEYIIQLNDANRDRVTIDPVLYENAKTKTRQLIESINTDIYYLAEVKNSIITLENHLKNQTKKLVEEISLLFEQFGTKKIEQIKDEERVISFVKNHIIMTDDEKKDIVTIEELRALWMEKNTIIPIPENFEKLLQIKDALNRTKKQSKKQDVFKGIKINES